MTAQAMDLVIFGLNHRTAPLSVRERWAFSEKEAREALLGAQDLVSASENLILSTCNRTEIYSLLPRSLDNGGARNLEDLLDYFHRIKNCRRESHGCFYTLQRKDAVGHLFRVAAGLDSMIVGEGQILRQLRDAYELARQAGSVGKVFLRLFPAALKAGKRIRAETGISEGCITHGQAALEIAREQLRGLRGKNVLLLGAGKVTRLVVKALREEGLSRLAVVSRTMEKAVRLASELAGEAFPIEDLSCLLEVSDLVISSTAATQTVVRAELMESVARKRDGRPLCIIDLAVPRDFDPACAGARGVSLFNIDHLNSVIQANIQERLTEVPRAEEIIREEERSFFGQMNWIHLDPVIKHLVERFEAIRVAEMERHIAHIPVEHRAAVDALTSSLLKKLLHFPIEKLKSLRDDEGLTPAEVSFLRRIFLQEARPAGGGDGESPHREPG